MSIKRIAVCGRSKVEVGRLTPTKKELLRGVACDESHYNYNGYGYQDHEYTYHVSRAQFRALKELAEKPKAERRTLTDEEKREQWARRLAKLAEIDYEEALEIAEEKEEYKQDRIDELEDRQCDHYSRRRATLIRAMKRANPLRRIKDADHARAILAASERHNCSDYEDRLEEARELAEFGELDKSEVRAYARENFKFYKK